jgi:hypothetical protein
MLRGLCRSGNFFATEKHQDNDHGIYCRGPKTRNLTWYLSSLPCDVDLRWLTAAQYWRRPQQIPGMIRVSCKNLPFGTPVLVSGLAGCSEMIALVEKPADNEATTA